MARRRKVHIHQKCFQLGVSVRTSISRQCGKKTKCIFIKSVFSEGFQYSTPSPGNARGQICFPALAFHEVTAKDMLGSHDGRTRQDCHLVTDK